MPGCSERDAPTVSVRPLGNGGIHLLLPTDSWNHEHNGERKYELHSQYVERYLVCLCGHLCVLLCTHWRGRGGIYAEPPQIQMDDSGVEWSRDESQNGCVQGTSLLHPASFMVQASSWCLEAPHWVVMMD